MNVLITGNLACLSTTLAKAFLKEKYRVVFAGSGSEAYKKSLPAVACHAISPADELFTEIIAAYRFDTVIYIATREEQLLQRDPYSAGPELQGLLHTLEMCRKKDVEKVYLISSTEIDGGQERPGAPAKVQPQPTTPNGLILKTAEEYCRYYHDQYGLSCTIVRVPFVYGPGEPDTLLAGLLRALDHQEAARIPAAEGSLVSFLHAADVADFILRSIEDPIPGLQVVNLSSADPLTFSGLEEMLQGYFPGARFTYVAGAALATRPANASAARRMHDWIPERKLGEALPEIIAGLRLLAPTRVTWLTRLRARFPRYPRYLKWVEVLLLTGLMFYLNGLSGVLVDFRHIDFRLIYVVLIGLTWGTQAGLVAAGLAALSLLYGWAQLDMNWLELVYNISSWLPFAVYLVAGTLSGYFHDKNENELQNQAEQNQLVQEKFRLLYQLYQEVLQIKNQFYAQLVGSRDSFGRIYRIARELDTLNAEEVLIKALGVLEDVLDNRSIAIYSVNQDYTYARLEVYSSSLRGQVTRSLKLADQPALIESIHQGEIFINRDLAGYLPAYFAPIRCGTATVAAVVVWQASFDQYSLYYTNLVRVVCGLVQSSIHRAAMFRDANMDKVYLPHTRILRSKPFKQVIQAKAEMQNRKIGDFLLLKVHLRNSQDGGDQALRSLEDYQKFYNLISCNIRAEDTIGVLEDGSCYILFSQADQSNAGQIEARLRQHGIYCKPEPSPAVHRGFGTGGLRTPLRQTGSLGPRPVNNPQEIA